MAEEADFVTLIEDEAPQVAAPAVAPWKIAIVDDDQGVHTGTRFALQDFTLHGRGLELLSARSAAEARDLFRNNPDMAVILLDVVMETEGAGLELVQFVREELKNETVRIILRTGQPGQAPERRVVVDYDINDYKAKTELTADKLFTTLTAALRSYDQLLKLVQTRRGLEIIIDAAASLFDQRSLQRLAEGVLTQLSSLMAVDCAGILVLRETGVRQFKVLAGSGVYKKYVAPGGSDEVEDEIAELIHKGFDSRRHDFTVGRYVLYMGTGSGRELVALMEADRELTDTDKALVEVFCSRLSAAFDNVTLYEELERANQRLEEKVARRTAQLLAAKERLENQSERLKSANAFKSEVLGTVAHDLKNPLGVILGRTEILNELLSATKLPEKAARDQIDHIRQSARRLTAMVEDLIADARADAVDISVRAYNLDFGTSGFRGLGGQPQAGRLRKEQELACRVRAGAEGARRHRTAARGVRQSRQQCGQVQPDRRTHRHFGSARGQGRGRAGGGRGPGTLAGRHQSGFRPLSAAFGQADRWRKLNRPRPLDRQTHHRTSQRQHLRGKSRFGGRGGVCNRFAAPR